MKWLVIKCWSNDTIECEVDEGNADEVIERYEGNINDVALVPLDLVLDALKRAKERKLI
ncbi:MAG: hypothetical protein ACQXXL_04460 [Candidatus Methanosuratincola sp.]|jgi:hypothetical protein|nr:hypothetical protein [Candidatus Methanosuratincola sp.]